MAYSTLEPLRAEDDYLGHAITAATVANSAQALIRALGSKQTAKQHEVSEFMPNFSKQEQTPDQMIQIAEMFTAANGGQDLRGENG